MRERPPGREPFSPSVRADLLGLGLADQVRETVEQPVADDRDVDPLVPAEVAAVARVAVARVSHDEPAVDGGAAGVAEARVSRTGGSVVGGLPLARERLQTGDAPRVHRLRFAEETPQTAPF